MSIKNVILIGPMCAGKSTTGRILAKKLNYQFCDTDQEIEKIHQKSISSIIKQEGEKHFRKYESEALKKCLEKKNIVLATGGGIILNAMNRALLKSHGAIVFLSTTLEEQCNRLKKTYSRPLLATNKPVKEQLEKLNAAREHWYKDTANITINTDNQAVSSITEQIFSKLGLTCL